MTNSEAFVETLVSRGVTDTFGIVGSAFMDSLDLFPSAGIRFISVQHEQNAAHMADGYARVSGRNGVCIAQNGPGISNFVTGVAAAYWAHSPIVAITPEAGTMTKGHGGFQEVGLGAGQLSMFESVCKYQADVNNAARIPEFTARAFDYALMERGPTQLNIPRDYFYGENEFKIPAKLDVEGSAGGEASLQAAVDIIAKAKNPVILSGGGVVMGDAINEVTALAEHLATPVATTYLHNDAFPSDHELWCGPLGYLGHKAGMHSVRDADVIICIGTRLGPFGTLPQYGEAYWPENAKIIQIDANPRFLGLTKEVDVAIQADAKKCASELLHRIKSSGAACEGTKDERLAEMKSKQAAWEAELDGYTYGAPHATDGRIKPRIALRELEKAMPDNAVVSTDIGNSCSVSNGYLRFKQPRSFLAAMSFGNCGYAFPAAIGAKVAAPDRPCVAYAGDGAWGMSLNETLTCLREKIPTTAVVFNNGQWGAEKKNQVLWFGDRYVGTQLENPSFAEIARAMGAEGITCEHQDQVGDALKKAVANQEEGKTTIVELMTTRELGDPFRRDAMKLPVRRLAKYKHTDRFEESPTGQPIDLQMKQ
jgi:sulfoacetaldehyde acetyltransferase